MIKVSNLTEAQKAWIDQICYDGWQCFLTKEGKSFIVADKATLETLIEDLESRLGDDHHMNVAEGSMKDLTDHQVQMVVDNILKCLNSTIKKIAAAIVKADEAERVTKLEGELTSVSIKAGKGIKEASADLTPAFTSATIKRTESEWTQAMIRYDTLKTFDLAFFATEAEALAFADKVVKAGDKYKMEHLDFLSCGREKHLDYKGHFAVSCNGRK